MAFNWKYEHDEDHLRVFLGGIVEHAEILENELDNYADYFEENHAPEIAAILRIQFLNMANGLTELAWGIEDLLVKNGLVDGELSMGYEAAKEAREELDHYKKELNERMLGD